MKRSYPRLILFVGGLIVAAINEKYFRAYSDPLTGSIALSLLTIIMLGGGFVSLFRAWLKSSTK